MKVINISISREVAQIINAQIGECAKNTALSFMNASHLMPLYIDYIEGLWIVEGQTDIHAWIETDDFIIDPTFVCLPIEWQRRGARYYPILQRAKDDFLGMLEKEEFIHKLEHHLELSWMDQRVETVRKKIDPP